MTSDRLLAQFKEIISNAAPGNVFIPSDFAKIASAATISVYLNRLKNSGELVSCGRGLFMKPRFSTLLNESVPPSTNDIARAIARKHGWTIIPHGDTALNMLGLSTQVPNSFSYISDGPYKQYSIGKTELQFLHTNRISELKNTSYETALTIQALKSLGKDSITDKDIQIIRRKLSTESKEKLLTEGQYATAWVCEYLKLIRTGGK